MMILIDVLVPEDPDPVSYLDQVLGGQQVLWIQIHNNGSDKIYLFGPNPQPICWKPYLSISLTGDIKT